MEHTGEKTFDASWQDSAPGASDTTESDRLGTLREGAADLKATLADKLDAGANRLRAHARATTVVSASGSGGSARIAADERLMRLSDSVATGMYNTADWLRTGDLKADVENQVREHPARSLLIALGVGYLIGKALGRQR